MIRPVERRDAEALDRLHTRAWAHAYADFLTPDQMIAARTPQEERVALWRERADHPEIRTWVYDQDGTVVGFASADPGELWALYVDPVAQGAGVGSALLEHAESVMRDQGSTEAVLWVFVANEHGRRFYERRGWELVEGSQEQGDWPAPGVMYRSRL